MIMALLLISSIHSAMAEEDPADETPTDDAISIQITSVENDLKPVSLTKFTLSIKVTGTTSTTNNSKSVHHIGTSLWTLYYKNGTVENGEVVEYGPDGMNFSSNDFTIRIIKIAENWTQWEISYETSFQITIDGQGNISGEMDDIDATRIFVRAYSDEDGANWTQASQDITDQYKNAWLGILPKHNIGGSSGDDEIPGFAIAGLLAAIGVATILKRRNLEY
jgi:hypothetical protein